LTVFSTETILPDERKRKCGRLWRLLDKKAQVQWKDPDFLEQYQDQSEQNNPIDDSSTTSGAKKRKKRGNAPFNMNAWANKIVADVSVESSHSNPLCLYLIRLTIGNLDNQSHVLVVAEFEPTLRR
jgi:hypothetical protein